MRLIYNDTCIFETKHKQTLQVLWKCDLHACQSLNQETVLKILTRLWVMQKISCRKKFPKTDAVDRPSYNLEIAKLIVRAKANLKVK